MSYILALYTDQAIGYAAAGLYLAGGGAKTALRFSDHSHSTPSLIIS